MVLLALNNKFMTLISPNHFHMMNSEISTNELDFIIGKRENGGYEHFLCFL